MKMKKFLKNVGIFAIMMLIVGMYITPKVAKAGYEYYFGVAFEKDGYEDYTTTEVKNTSSSVWMRCTTAESDDSYYSAYVYAVTSYGNRYDASKGNFRNFYKGDSYNLVNWVNERGYNRACVKCVGHNINEEYGSVFGGYWSPDI